MNQVTIGLVQNAALLLALAAVLDLTGTRDYSSSHRTRQLLAGAAVGTIAVAMISLSVSIGAGVIIDTRSVILSVTGLFLGLIPCAVAVVLAAGYRLLVGGTGALVGVSVILSSASVGLIWRHARGRRSHLDRISALELYAVGIAVHLLMVAQLSVLPGSLGRSTIRAVGLPIIVVYPIATVALGLLFVRRMRRRRIIQEVHASELKFRLLAENARDVIFRFELHPHKHFAYVSPSVTRLTGLTPDELYADPGIALELIHSEDRSIAEEAIAGDSSPAPLTLRIVRKDGSVRWTDQRFTPQLGESGEVVAIEGIVRDVSEPRETLNQLRSKEETLRLALEAARQAVYDLDVRLGTATLSADYSTMLGYDPNGSVTATRQQLLNRLHPDDRARAASSLEDYLEGRSTELRVECRRQCRDGSWIWTLDQGTVVARDENRNPTRVLGTIQDITNLKSAELAARRAHEETERHLIEAERNQRALMESQRLSQATLDALRENICVLDGMGRIVAVNAAWKEFASKNGAPNHFEGLNYLDVCSRATGPDRAMAIEFSSKLVDVLDGNLESFSVSYPCHSPDQRRWFLAQVSRFAEGGPARVVIAHEDITEEIVAEEALGRLTRILQASQSAAIVGGWELDPGDGSMFLTDEAYRILGVTPEEFTPTYETVLSFFTEESVARIETTLEEVLEHPESRRLELELELVSGEETLKSVELFASVVEDKGALRITGAVQDITARKTAELERLNLTKQLFQAQKMESLGSLAGGIAHDMNNVLAAVMNATSVHRKQLDDATPLAHSLDLIIKACMRGRSVIGSLLYFGRRDLGSSTLVDLNTIAREIQELLAQTTLQRIRIETDLEEHLERVRGDAAALTHAIMNLCLNSIDAIETTGEVTIRTRNCADGTVSVSVRDNGPGMTDEVLTRAVEPFFTTKPLGKGTGLGLAMVYGTTKASGGTFELTSETGKGTVATMTFSAVSSSTPEELPPPPAAPEVGSMRILLVDDDELILESFPDLLEALGHEVETASDGRTALSLFERGLTFDLVILDMNMPEMTGAELLPMILEISPGQDVLICTGFTDDEHKDLVEKYPGIGRISKPFTVDELKRALVQVKA